MTEDKREQQEPTQDTEARTGESIVIADEVVGVIAGIAAAEIPGVVTLGGGFVDGISGILGKKSASRGVKVETKTDRTVIDLQLVVEYGARIPEVSRSVQESVKVAVESMTGLTVVAVNIHVQGVSFRHEGKPRDTKKESR